VKHKKSPENRRGTEKLAGAHEKNDKNLCPGNRKTGQCSIINTNSGRIGLGLLPAGGCDAEAKLLSGGQISGVKFCANQFAPINMYPVYTE